MRKLTNIVKSLWLGIGKWNKESFNVIHVFGINGCMSVNKLLTFINRNCDQRKEDNSSLDESDKSIIFVNLEY